MKRRRRLLEALHALDFDWALPGHQEIKSREALFAGMEEALAEDIADGVMMQED